MNYASHSEALSLSELLALLSSLSGEGRPRETKEEQAVPRESASVVNREGSQDGDEIDGAIKKESEQEYLFQHNFSFQQDYSFQHDYLF